MEARKSVKLDIIKKGNDIVCSDLATLGLVLGTRGVAGNLNLYGVKKEKGKFIISISKIKKRIKELERRKAKIDDYLGIMRQVI